MPLEICEVTDVLCILCDEAELKVTVKESLKGGAIAGTATAIGGVLGGPIGLAVGGALGGLTAAYLASGKFKSVSSIIREMDDNQKQKLYDKCIEIFQRMSIEDAVALQQVVTGDPVVQQRLVRAVMNHFEQDLRIEIIE